MFASRLLTLIALCLDFGHVPYLSLVVSSDFIKSHHHLRVSKLTARDVGNRLRILCYVGDKEVATVSSACTKAFA